MADQNQVRTLSIRQLMDSSDYARGAREFTDANKAMSSSSAIVGVTVTETSNKISNAASAAEKLRRQLIPGAADAAKLESAVRQLNAEFTRGKLSADEHAIAMDNAFRRYGNAESAIELMRRGQTDLAATIRRTTVEVETQANAIRAANQNTLSAHNAMVDSAAQYRKQNLGAQLLDIGQTAALGAPLSMIALQQGPQIAGIYAQQGGIKAMLSDLGGIAKTVAPAAVALAGLYGVYRLLDANSAEARLSVDALTRSLAEQAAPIGSLSGQVDELKKIQATYNDALLTTASAQTDATRTILANSEREFNAKKSLLELELKRQEAAQKYQESLMAIEGLHLKQEVASQVNQPVMSPVAGGYADPRINGGIPFVRLPDSASGMAKLQEVIANSPASDKIKEMQANATLADIAVQKLREGLQLAFDAGSELMKQGDDAYAKGKAYTDAMLRVQAYYHSVYNPPNVALDKVPTPGGRPANFFQPIDSDPDSAATKTETAYQQLMRTADQRIAQVRNEIAIAGQSAEMQARLRLEFEMTSQAQEAAARNGKQLSDQEIAAIKGKADALAALNQVSAGHKFDQGQQDQIAQLQLQASLIGKSADEQARATAVFQADMQMRQAGLSLLGEEADRRRAVAAAMADAGQQIQRQQAAYQSLQEAEGSVIDTIVSGSGSVKQVLSDVTKWLVQMSVANPIKNACIGEAFTFDFTKPGEAA